MQLKEYLTEFNISAYDLARICGIAHSIVYRVLHGGNISKKTAMKIKKKTGGKVDYKNIYTPKGCQY